MAQKRDQYFRSHQCTLPHTNGKYVPDLPPFAPFYSKLRRSILKCCLLSETNPNCKEYFVSSAQIFREKQRQVSNKQYIVTIHPLSQLAWIRERILCTLWFTLFFWDPYYGTFVAPEMYTEIEVGTDIFAHELNWGLYFQICLNTILVINIGLGFFAGYIERRTKKVVLGRKKIAKRYLRSYFIFDVLSMIMLLRRRISFKRGFYTMFPVYQFHHFRFIRLITAVSYMKKWLRSFKFKDSTITVAVTTMVLLVMLHWWTCLLFLIPQANYYKAKPLEKSWVTKANIPLGKQRGMQQAVQYVQTAAVALCHFYGAGVARYRTELPLEMILLSFITISGGVLYTFVIAEALHLFGALNVSDIKYEELMNQLNEYMILKKFSPRLKNRMVTYCQYKFQKKFFHEKNILGSLSEHLRYEVKFYNCRSLISNTRIFRGVSKEAVGSILGFLRSEIYLPEDEILGEDSEDLIFFISYGTVMGMWPNADGIVVEALHMEDGQHFGYLKLVKWFP